MSSNEAMAAKARAMFGERLGSDQYEALLQKQTIGDIVAYLKQQPLFKTSLAGVNEKAIHRGQLEILLRVSVYERLFRLLRYGSEFEGRFLIGASMHTEIDLIMMTIRMLITPDDELRSQLITQMPIFILHYMSFDVRKLADVYAFEQLYDLLKSTTYEPILKRYRSKPIEEMDVVMLEYDLRENYYQNLLQMAREISNREDRDQLQKLIRMRAELENVTDIYRLKKYFAVNNQAIKRQIAPIYALFTQREMEQMIMEEDAPQVVEHLARKYHAYVKDAKFSFIENYIEKIVYNMYYNTIETNTSAPLVLISYMHLSNMEIRNLINIVEGVRYRVSNDRVRALLVY